VEALGALALICVFFPLFLAPLAVVVVLHYLILHLYRVTSRELRRLNSQTRSPLFAHVAETLDGLTTLRAYRVQEAFTRVNDRLLDVN
jgi:hypothetical protein